MIGIDVYQQFNAVTSWQGVKNAGVQYVYVKLTDGAGQAIVHADAYVAGARSVGLRVGGYHYLEATPTPEQQADVFAAELRRLNALDLAPALDIEEPSIPSGSRIAYGQRFLRRLQANLGTKTPVAVYSSASWFAALHPDTWGIPNLLDWVAAYGPNDGLQHAISGYGGHVDGHQYTSVGHIAGITGSVDKDELSTNFLAALTATVTRSDNMADFFVKLSTGQSDGTYAACAEQCGAMFTGITYANAKSTVDKNQGSLTGLSDAEWNDRVAKSAGQEALPGKLDAVIAAITALPSEIAAALPAGGGNGLTDAQIQEDVKAAFADMHGNTTFGY